MYYGHKSQLLNNVFWCKVWNTCNIVSKRLAMIFFNFAGGLNVKIRIRDFILRRRIQINLIKVLQGLLSQLDTLTWAKPSYKWFLENQPFARKHWLYNCFYACLRAFFSSYYQKILKIAGFCIVLIVWKYVKYSKSK